MRQRGILVAISAVLLGAWLLGTLGGPGRRDALEGERAPDFTLPVVMGEGAGKDRLRLSDLHGQVVVLDFWASWCGPCRASVPMLSSLQRELGGKGLRIVGVNGEQGEPSAYAFLERSWGFSYPSVQDPAHAAQAAYDVQGYPTVVVIDRTGTVDKVYPGAPTEAGLRARIENLLD